MQVIVIPDNYIITTVSDEGNACKDCLFYVCEPDDGRLVNFCGFDSRTRVPCVDTVYAVIPNPYLDED